MYDRRGVGVALRRIRLDRGLTQDALAERAAVSQAALSLYEKGKRDMSLKAAVRLVEVLGLSGVDALLEEAA